MLRDKAYVLFCLGHYLEYNVKTCMLNFVYTQLLKETNGQHQPSFNMTDIIKHVDVTNQG